jgi:hypothetical protein
LYPLSINDNTVFIYKLSSCKYELHTIGINDVDVDDVVDVFVDVDDVVVVVDDVNDDIVLFYILDDTNLILEIVFIEV